MINDIMEFQSPHNVAKLLTKISGKSLLDEIPESLQSGNNENKSNASEIFRDHTSKSQNNSDAEKVKLMEKCIQFLMHHRRSFSVDMDISAKNIVTGQISSILKLIWLVIVRFRLEAIADKQLQIIKMEVSCLID